MIHVSPRQLQVFVQAVAAGSLRGAADALHLTPPAASMALAIPATSSSIPLITPMNCAWSCA